MALEQVHHWWDGPFMRRAPVASLGDMFWGRGLTGKELARAEGEYPSEDFLEGPDSSYMVTLIPQLIDTMASNFVPLPSPPQANLV